jgi:hypothetical protein
VCFDGDDNDVRIVVGKFVDIGADLRDFLFEIFGTLDGNTRIERRVYKIGDNIT